ncbi:unnamed protein product [Staurois parvus]|uniref:Uncharacterized protein n=1 Tax=Staurois parvus TaxID=386267 RepID=A0ABN9H8Y0_9NEOB|nr:unnamed protein product [Staurois parvus]
MGPPTDPGPSGSAREPEWSVRPWANHSITIVRKCHIWKPFTTVLLTL